MSTLLLHRFADLGRGVRMNGGAVHKQLVLDVDVQLDQLAHQALHGAVVRETPEHDGAVFHGVGQGVVHDHGWSGVGQVGQEALGFGWGAVVDGDGLAQAVSEDEVASDALGEIEGSEREREILMKATYGSSHLALCSSRSGVMRLSQPRVT